ncbi:homoserine kinase [Methyloversatilis sp.]|uniref:homoserine kinase n=1 Tax=Methyloversatilis sp. TaxID=2569862 RepID=UPI002733F271|nr:homoserine kinase [Methyloversatilis sp.]MDP2867263.1 homoserine kinase [Methyloversatilis sp.]MDP3287799.1 homoserine kinase [Methyloversatilis sp.]MDP3456738.1 homoserine kinase [Methyloversatilis sp.]MDP3576974.1 homoserine kinase [Methyloversatilis sp.]
MSVFTSVTADEMRDWLKNYSIGHLLSLEGIPAGIENTNYFVDTSHGRYVLTLFEKLTRAELPFYVHLMAHLSRHGIPCPAPIADRDNEYLGTLNGKPAMLATRLAGKSQMAPQAAHCAAVGGMLATMHVAGQSYGRRFANPRGYDWWRAAAPQLLGYLDADDRALLESEMAFQVAARDGGACAGLPAGVVHADLFRDNCLMDGERIGGVIDFYFAGDDYLLFDLAVTMNDWCSDEAGELVADRADAMLAAYRDERPLSDAEHRAWPLMLRAAALRFWLSRLYDFHLPRDGEMVHKHDPKRFRDILRARIRAGDALPWQ